MQPRYLVVALDPGTGISSPTGFTVFDPESLEIYYANNINTKRKPLAHRIKEISDIFEETIKDIDKMYQNSVISVCIEQFVMRGKGGESLQRLIGSLMGRVPYRMECVHVQNTTVKFMMAGHGHADKSSVARGMADFFICNPDSRKLIEGLIATNEYDILDSLSIGVSGWKVAQKSLVSASSKPRMPRSSKKAKAKSAPA